MRAEKQFLTNEYIERLSSSPFAIVVDYQGLRVDQFTSLRKKLVDAEAEIHVVKNSILVLAAKEVGLPDLKGMLTGQVAVVTGQKDISTAAKVIKSFASEAQKPAFRIGFLDNQQLDVEQLQAIAELPPLDVLRGQIIGMIQAPAEKLVRLINTPAAQLAQVIKAHAEKSSDGGAGE